MTAEEMGWKDVIGFEGYYKISNDGLVFSYHRGIIMKPIPHADGYLVVSLSATGKKKRYSIHRLVALHFIPNPNNYDSVNHKDFNKANNHYSNLEWCTHKQNMRHAYANGRISRNGVTTDYHKAQMAKLKKNVIAYNPQTKEVLTFLGHQLCADHFGIGRKTISATIIYKNKAAGTHRLFHEKEWRQFKTENNL